MDACLEGAMKPDLLPEAGLSFVPRGYEAAEFTAHRWPLVETNGP
jgi:hypothetical protein